jgi:Spy/CpxP family protein refolding chaperone
MNKHDEKASNHAPARKNRLARRWILAATLAMAAGAMATAGASFAGSGDGMFGHHRHGQHMAMDPAALDKHIDNMVNQVLADGTPEQKAKLAGIVKSAFADLRPAHDQFHLAHARAHALLTSPVIDRAALEQLRVEQMQQMDFVSKRVLEAVEDAAELLTPTQRVKFADHLRARMH